MFSLIPLPYKILACAVMAAALAVGGFVFGYRYEAGQTAKDKLAAATKAAEITATLQKKVNDDAKAHQIEIAAINDSLAAALVELRKRPARMPEVTRASCKGTTGAELSGTDAEFLAGEAARADRQREALKTCYSYADTVAK